MKLLALIIFSLSAAVHAAPVEFNISNVNDTTGSIIFSMFDSSASWDSSKPTATLSIAAPNKGTSTFKGDLAPGDYAFFVYHDVDNNGELEQNAFGMPTEPFGFSNDFKLGFSKPTWQQIKFTVSASGATQVVTLQD